MLFVRSYVRSVTSSEHFTPVLTRLCSQAIAWASFLVATQFLLDGIDASWSDTIKQVMLWPLVIVTAVVYVIDCFKSPLPAFVAFAALLVCAVLQMPTAALIAFAVTMVGLAIALARSSSALASWLPVLGIGLAAAAAHDDAQAAKVMDIRDGDTAIAIVSARDQTRIRADRGRILDLFGDIYDPKQNPNGRLMLVKDDAAGEVFVKFLPGASALSPLPAPSGLTEGAAESPPAAGVPSPAASLGGPLKLDVKTSSGTVGLLLHPQNVVGDTIVLKVIGGATRAAPADSNATAGRTPAHVRAVKALTLAMAAPEYGDQVPARPAAGGGEEVGLWKEARFVLQARYDAPGLVGESYLLQNISSARMVVDERELFRDGVVSVALKQLALDPGESTPVWIVRMATERD